MQAMPPRKPLPAAVPLTPQADQLAAWAAALGVDLDDPKERLVFHAACLFAEHGFDAVTTREICAAAGTNPGAIHYHFGDKDGLYREVLRRPIQQMSAAFAGFDDPALTLAQALDRFLAPFSTVIHGEGPNPMRLYLRELLDPSEVFMQALATHIGPNHHALARLLARHIGVDEPDAAVHQLAYALVAIAHDYCLSRPFMDALTPGLLDNDPELTAVRRRIVGWGVALVAAERAARAAPNPDLA